MKNNILQDISVYKKIKDKYKLKHKLVSILLEEVSYRKDQIKINKLITIFIQKDIIIIRFIMLKALI
jgi:hypothetical protein